MQAIDRRRAGMLPVPANYYDDVAARLALDDTLLARLQRLGMLYDRDAHGDFLHAYTAPFQQRFFFEIVQRDGYRGYGRPMPRCMAALTQLEPA